VPVRTSLAVNPGLLRLGKETELLPPIQEKWLTMPPEDMRSQPPRLHTVPTATRTVMLLAAVLWQR